MAKQRKKEPESATVLRFSDDHLWIRAEEGRAHIGISDLGQDRIGEIIAVELPDLGDAVEKGEPFGEIESVVTVLELVAPITGVVSAVNGDLDDHPSLANEDPYHEGWLVEVELSDEDELDSLMSIDDYEDYVARGEEEEPE